MNRCSELTCGLNQFCENGNSGPRCICLNGFGGEICSGETKNAVFVIVISVFDFSNFEKNPGHKKNQIQTWIPAKSWKF